MKCPCCNGTDHDTADLQGEHGFTRGEICQLFQLKHAGLLGVWAGDLMDKESTRELVQRGYADNTGGPPSSLKRVYINRVGRHTIEAFQA